MPAKSKGDSILTLDQLANVQWAILGCSLNLTVGNTLYVKTFLGVAGNTDPPDMFGLSLCCDNGSTGQCAEFYTFIGAGEAKYKGNHPAPSNFVIQGANQVICSSTVVPPFLSTCGESNLRFRFASGTSASDEQIALEKLSIECVNDIPETCETSDHRMAPIGNLSIPSGSALYQEYANSIASDKCRYVRFNPSCKALTLSIVGSCLNLWDSCVFLRVN